MANPFLGVITSQFKQTFKNAIDALLEETALTLPCRFIYGVTKYTQCGNCIVNQATGKSTNIYLSGGPVPFQHGSCPVCQGEGKISVTTPEDAIYLAVIYDFKKWIPMGSLSMPTTPENYIQTLCKIALLPKINKAKELIVNTDIEAYQRNRFIIHGKPQPLGLGEDAYLATMWRVSG